MSSNPFIRNIGNVAFTQPATSFTERQFTAKQATVDPGMLEAIISNPQLVELADPRLLLDRLIGTPRLPPLPIPKPEPSAPVLTFDAIPIAREGDVITAEYHNALRQAVLTLAEVAGVAELTRTNLQPGFPDLRGIAEQPSWLQDRVPGVAVKPDGSAAEGWMPLRLPDLGRIEKLRVTGRKTGIVGELTVKLVRQELRDPSVSVTLASLALDKAAEAFREEIEVTPEGTPSQREAFKRIDNSTYLYYARAKLAGAAGGSDVRLTAIQVLTQA